MKRKKDLSIRISNTDDFHRRVYSVETIAKRVFLSTVRDKNFAGYIHAFNNQAVNTTEMDAYVASRARVSHAL
jgi:hypothetical protein